MGNPFGRNTVIALTNKSGGSVAAGDLVYIDTANNDSFTTGTTSAYTKGIGIAQQAIASNAVGLVLIDGYAALVNVNASVTRGNFLKSHTVVKQGTDAGASRIAGTCGMFLTGGTTPDAIIWQPDLGAGSGLTDPMTTRGDIIYRNAANSTDRLGIPAAGQVIGRSGSDLAAVYPPGYEMAYVEFTSPVSPTATTEATADSVVSAGSVSFDGSTVVLIEGYIPNCVNRNATDNTRFWLYDGSSSIGEIGRTTNPAASTVAVGVPIYVCRRMTPSNAAHTYSIRVSTGGSGASIGAGAGGAGNIMPGYIRITRV